MTITRSPRKTQNFTILGNDICQNKVLTMRALGMLVRLLSYPDNWNTNSETLARDFGCGREQIRSVLKELVSAGYMRLNKFQNASGHWISQWAVSETSLLPNINPPEPSQPEPAQPEPGNPYAGALGAFISTNLKRTNTGDPDEKPTGKQTKEEAKASLPSTGLPDCPHETLIDTFQKHLPGLPQPIKSLWRKSANAKALKSRWVWVLTACHEKGERSGQRMATNAQEATAWFDRYFAYVSRCEFLVSGSFCSLGWLVKSQNFEKVLSGNYEQKEKAQS